ncbi:MULTISPECIES: murein L,D-transpeptidase family protein [Emticicia]|uniref:L,D-transpeptidase family protein n=1 Tax=Emticicia TaxID=312278 RepID=UPI00209CF58E|nr:MULTISPECIES: L,D-transpeptidase family protein [Emticicia]UTA70293.1 hypothetical protein MB380_10810 [Emticicia sp. 21SJ11W-3]
MGSDNLLQKQLLYERVANAYKAKSAMLDSILVEKSIKNRNFRLFIRVFKKEQLLEAWIKHPEKIRYELLRKYNFTGSSGNLGPKRKSGDGQIPEGIYQITNFNPLSAFHLSLRVNYPNIADIHWADSEHPGGDIYLHGGNTSTGCIPVGDDCIEELYLLSVYAADAGHLPDVHIYPSSMAGAAFNSLITGHSNNIHLIDFWHKLKAIFDDFEQTNALKSIKTDQKGHYYLAD